MEHVAFSKIPRLSRDCVITEKIDGTNAQILITDDECGQAGCTGLHMHIGSRNRWLSAEQDNYGFYKWCQRHREELLTLGPGRHYGEWWGGGIQRGYGLKGDDKRFSLFHVHGIAALPECVSVVPTLWIGPFSTEVAQAEINRLQAFGSVAVPGYMKPEGIVIYHVASGHLYKKTVEGDASPKGTAE